MSVVLNKVNILYLRVICDMFHIKGLLLLYLRCITYIVLQACLVLK